MPLDIDWSRYDALRAQGLPRRECARDLALSESSIRDAEKRRPSTAQGASSGTPVNGDHPTGSVLPVPVLPDWTRPLQDLEARLIAYIDQRLAEVIGPSGPRQVPQGPQVPIAQRTVLPGYPEDPMKDGRYNLHLPAGELWELKAVAASMGLDVSHLLRQVWQAFRGSPQGQQALHQALPGLLSAAELEREDLAREER